MRDKVTVTSFAAVSSKQVRRKCPRCKKTERAELVDYGKGGHLLFCACGEVREVRK